MKNLGESVVNGRNKYYKRNVSLYLSMYKS